MTYLVLAICGVGLAVVMALFAVIGELRELRRELSGIEGCVEKCSTSIWSMMHTMEELAEQVRRIATKKGAP